MIYKKGGVEHRVFKIERECFKMERAANFI